MRYCLLLICLWGCSQHQSPGELKHNNDNAAKTHKDISVLVQKVYSIDKPHLLITKAEDQISKMGHPILNKLDTSSKWPINNIGIANSKDTDDVNKYLVMPTINSAFPQGIYFKWVQRYAGMDEYVLIPMVKGYPSVTIDSLDIDGIYINKMVSSKGDLMPNTEARPVNIVLTKTAKEKLKNYAKEPDSYVLLSFGFLGRKISEVRSVEEINQYGILQQYKYFPDSIKNTYSTLAREDTILK